jgi:hypothetical protein
MSSSRNVGKSLGRTSRRLWKNHELQSTFSKPSTPPSYPYSQRKKRRIRQKILDQSRYAISSTKLSPNLWPTESNPYLKISFKRNKRVSWREDKSLMG